MTITFTIQRKQLHSANYKDQSKTRLEMHNHTRDNSFTHCLASQSLTVQTIPLQDSIMCFSTLHLVKAVLLLTLCLSTYATDTLGVGTTMTMGSNLTSPDGLTSLIFQSDGNLCIYKLINNKSYYLWGTGTNGSGAEGLVLSPDGNIVMFSSSSNVVWQSKSTGHYGQDLVLTIQDDSNLVMYADGYYSWASATVRPTLFSRISFENLATTSVSTWPIVKDTYTGAELWDPSKEAFTGWAIYTGTLTRSAHFE